MTNISTSGTNGEDDRLILSSGGIDFSTISSTNIEKIDLTQNGNTDLSNITLQEVIDITDGANDLIIIANNGDTIALTDGNWTQGSDVTYGNQTFETFTNSGDPTVHVQISEEATVSVA